jgi:hypothetical protein
VADSITLRVLNQCDDDQPMSTMEAARRLAFLLASAKEEQKRQMVDVMPNASDPERQT